jgi:hypothetical protein
VLSVRVLGLATRASRLKKFIASVAAYSMDCRHGVNQCDTFGMRKKLMQRPANWLAGSGLLYIRLQGRCVATLLHLQRPHAQLGRTAVGGGKPGGRSR